VNVRPAHQWLLLAGEVKSAAPELAGNRAAPPITIMDLDHDLPDQRPVLLPYALQHVQLGALDVDLEQVDALEFQLAERGGESAQLAAQDLAAVATLQARLDLVGRDAGVEHRLSDHGAVGFDVGVQP
jgi:hypothetical protein